MSAPNVVIDGVALAINSRWRLRQSYTKVRPLRDARTAAGGLIRRLASWEKIDTVIAGEGKLPFALANLDESTAVLVSCAAPRHAGSSSNVVELPAGRRSGGQYDPIAFAVVDGELVRTPVVVVTNTATCTAIAGADSYQVSYFPEFSGLVQVEENQLDQGNGTHAHIWQIIAREV